MIKKAVIPAAGLGTRFLPATKVIPKEMLSVVDRPVIQYIVDEAVKSGIEEIIFIVSKGKSAILEHFLQAVELEKILVKHEQEDELKILKETYVPVKFKTVEQKTPKGLGDAILCAKQEVGDEPFLVLLGDDLVDSAVPCCKQMIEVFEKYNKSIVSLLRVQNEEVSQYGICAGNKLGDRVFNLDTMIEKPSEADAPSNLAIIGRYLLKPSIFRYLEGSKRDSNDILGLTDAMSKMMQEEGFIGYEFDGQRFDAGEKFGLIKANIAFALKRMDLRQKLTAYIRDLGLLK